MRIPLIATLLAACGSTPEEPPDRTLLNPGTCLIWEEDSIRFGAIELDTRGDEPIVQTLSARIENRCEVAIDGVFRVTVEPLFSGFHVQEQPIQRVSADGLQTLVTFEPPPSQLGPFETELQLFSGGTIISRIPVRAVVVLP